MALAVALAGACFLAGSPAEAGGSPLSFERNLANGEWYAPGELAIARGDFGPGCCDRGWLEDGPWFAEIVRFDDAGTTVGEPIAVGELRVEQVPYEYNGRQLFRHDAVVEFVVPDVAHGSYVLNHCNDPCTKQLGSLTAGWFRIGPPPVDVPEPVEAPPTPSAVPSTTVASTTPPTTAAREQPVTTVEPKRDEPTPSTSTSVPLIAAGVGIAVAGGTTAKLMRRRNR
jgi:hypothetical protein